LVDNEGMMFYSTKTVTNEGNMKVKFSEGVYTLRGKDVDMTNMVLPLV
jgi:hypothetical protein